MRTTVYAGDSKTDVWKPNQTSTTPKENLASSPVGASTEQSSRKGGRVSRDLRTVVVMSIQTECAIHSRGAANCSFAPPTVVARYKHTETGSASLGSLWPLTHIPPPPPPPPTLPLRREIARRLRHIHYFLKRREVIGSYLRN